MIFLPLLFSLIVIVLVFYVFFSSATVRGPSMLPTLLNGDCLLITHGDSSPHRGDIVVTQVDEGGGPIELVKRVIALPGDTVEIRDDVAYVNGSREPAARTGRRSGVRGFDDCRSRSRQARCT